MKRRSLIFLFTDMFETSSEDEKLFEALRHLKYNKHDVILFHLLDKETEMHFNFENTPKRFIDVESGQHIDLYADTVKAAYEQQLSAYLASLKLKCAQYKIKYVDVDIAAPFSKVLNTFMVERQQFL